jgi:hypothetical protein
VAMHMRDADAVPRRHLLPDRCGFESLTFAGRVLDADWGHICCNGTHVQLWDDLGDSHTNQRWGQIQWSRS